MNIELRSHLQKWKSYFEENRGKSLKVFDENDVPITEEECDRIKNSIAAFQLGEFSEGKNLIHFADDFSQKHACPDLHDITKMFIKEEQNHAMLLKLFMEKNDMRVIQKNWTDSVFRGLRKYLGFELSITILITAEMLAMIYYPSLAKNTNSRNLREICKNMEVEEAKHIEYESKLLEIIRLDRSSFIRACIRISHRTFITGTAVVVYLTHYRVFKYSGYTFWKFLIETWMIFEKYFGKKS